MVLHPGKVLVNLAQILLLFCEVEAPLSMTNS